MLPMRQRKYNYYIKNGWYPQEAIELSRVSREGMKANYFQTMLRSRRRTVENLKGYGYTDTEIREYIKKQYIDKGFIKYDRVGRRRIDVWALVRDYEDKAHRRGEEYDSPWKKRGRTKAQAKRERKRTTRREAIQSWINQLDKTIDRTTNEERRDKLIQQRDNLKDMLNKMETENG